MWHCRYSTMSLHVNTATAVNVAFIGNFFEFSFTWVSCQVESSNCWLKFSPDGEWWSWTNKHLKVNIEHFSNTLSHDALFPHASRPGKVLTRY